MLITQALQELNLIDKKIAEKQRFLSEHLYLGGGIKDPFEEEGGIQKKVAAAWQSQQDLYLRKVAIRRAINEANLTHVVTVDDVPRTVAEWIIWRREVLPTYRKNVTDLLADISKFRKEALRQEIKVIEGGTAGRQEVQLNISEGVLRASLEFLTSVEEHLDAELSIFNATTSIDIQ